MGVATGSTGSMKDLFTGVHNIMLKASEQSKPGTTAREQTTEPEEPKLSPGSVLVGVPVLASRSTAAPVESTRRKSGSSLEEPTVQLKSLLGE